MNGEPLGRKIMKALKIDPKNVAEVRLMMKAGNVDCIEIVRFVSGFEHSAIIDELERYEVSRKP